MRTGLQNILRTLDVLAVELRAVVRRIWTVDEPCAVRPPAMVRQLESRVLLSASPAAAVADGATTDAPTVSADGDLLAAVHSDDLARSSTATPAADAASDSQAAVRRELLFVDSGIADCRQLVDGLRNGDTILDVVELDAEQDGIEQISSLLAQYSDLAAVHFVTHGTEGAVKLGNTWLTADNLAAYAGQVALWANSLATDADLLFYGCDVAANADGQTLLESLAALTGADVAASTDATGDSRLGGNWNLEYASGRVDSSEVLSPASTSHWSGLLATVTVSTTADLVDGTTTSIATLLANPGADGFISLREAILATNSTVGADTIFLPAGTFTLALGGQTEDAAATGDLDIADALTIVGVGSGLSIIDANGLDRVIDVRPGISATISDVTIRGGALPNNEYGAGVLVDSGAALTLSHVAITANSTGSGAGLYNYGTLLASDTTFSNNVANDWGGGLYNDRGSATLARVTISGNTAGKEGAGIWNGGSGAVMSLANVTLSSNTATGNGGGLYTSQSVTATNVTIAFNAAATGDGVFALGGGSVTFQNSLLYNPAGSNANKPMISLGHNLDSDGTAGLAAGGDQSGTVGAPLAVMLDPLQDNGGFVATNALLAGSPAIDAGTTVGAPAVDARNVVRDAAPDIGAFEVHVELANRSEFRVNATTGNQQETSAAGRGSQRAIALAPSGDYVVVWSSLNQDGDGWGVYAQRFDKDGNTRGGEFRVNTVTASDQQWVTVSMDDSGNFVATWSSGSDIFMRRFQTNGTAVDGADVRVNTIAANTQQNPSVIVNGSGDFVIAWEGNGAGAEGIYVRQGTFSGGLSGSDMTVTGNSTAKRPSAGIADNGDFVVVWDQYSDLFDNGIRAALFNANGTLKAPGIIDIKENFLAQHAAVDMNGGGNWVVVWSEPDDDVNIHAKRFAVDGTQLSTGTITVTATSGIQDSPSVAIDEDGDYVIVWQGNGTGDDSGVFARRYDNSDHALGPEELVNTTTANTQDRASVGMLDRDNYVVVWTGSDGSQTDVYARQFGATAPVNADPVAEAGGPYAISQGESLNLDGSASADPDADPLTYAWDLDNDGIFGEAGEPTGAVPTVNWATLQGFGITGGGSYTIGLRVDDAQGGVDTATATITVNSAPTITSNGGGATAAVSLAENTTAVTTVTATDADLPGQTLTYSISGGVDGAKFAIDGSTGVLSFLSAPDFESPTDVGGNNVYDVTVQASDGTLTDTQGIAVTVTDVVEGNTAWYNPAWGYRKIITIDHTKVAADETSFPVLINTIDPNWRSTGNGGHVGQTDGGDFLFTLTDGVTKLDYEIESYDPTTGQLVAWVRVPTLSSSTDTSIALYYGNAGAADQWNPTGVWNSDYRGIWHLNQATGVTAADSTANANDATQTDNPAASTGQIGGALTYSDPSRLTIGADPTLDLTTYSDWTMSAWVKPTSYTGLSWPIIYSYGNFRATMGLTVKEAGADGLIENWTNDSKKLQSDTAVTLDAWNYVTISRTATTTTFYLNGVAVGSGTSTTVATAGQASYIGGVPPFSGETTPSVTTQFLGLIDEVRVSGANVSDGSRSASWIATEYANQSAPAAFYLVNYEEAAAPQTPFQAGWGYGQQITIDHTKVYANLSDFPVLINTTNAMWKSTGNGGYVSQTDGGDFLFTAADGVTKLHFEIERYDPTTGQLVAWVRVPDLSMVTDTVINLYYGQATAVDQWNPTGVWDTNFKSVYHLSQAAGGAGAILDSTANVNNGTDSGNPTLGAGSRIGSGVTLDGTNDYIRVSDAASLDLTQDFTLGAWFSPTTTFNTSADSLGGLLDKGGYRFFLDKSDGKLKAVSADGTTTWAVSYNGAQEYFHSFATYNGDLYAGQGNGAGDGDIYRFDGTTWSISRNEATLATVYALAEYQGKLYAAQGNTAGAANVLVYDGTSWTTSYDGAASWVDSFAVYNGKLYAGIAGATGEGDVLVFDGTSWTTAYNGSQEGIYALAVYNGKLYAGQGSGTGDGDVLVYDGTSWTTSYNGAQEDILSLAVYDGKLYAGQAHGTGDVLVYDGTSWTTSFNGAQEQIGFLAVYNGRLYAGQGTGTGNGDVFVYDGATWSTSYDGAQEHIDSLGVYNGKLYAGQGSGTGDGDVLVMDAGTEVQSSTTSWAADTYHYATITKSGTTLSVYVDGTLQSTVTARNTVEANDLALLIGKAYGTEGGGTGEGLFQGTVDEVRVANTARSIGWIQTEYYNQNAPGSFYTLANEAPVLDSTKSPALTAQSEDSGAPSGAVGTLISNLVDFASPAGQVDNVTDVDSGPLLGIAVTAADTANGSWYYSINGGTNWSALGAVADNNARLLAADANTRLYFQPHADWNGTLTSAVTFRAWDQTNGGNGTLADASTNGGSTAFSTATDTVSLVIAAVNDAPVITSNGGGPTATISVAENTTTVTTVAATDADLPAQTLTYSISGGADAAKFAINGSTGVLSFLAAPNYEVPTDAGANNVYDVTVQASDGTLTDTQAIAVTVTAVNDNNPVISSNGGGPTATISVAENTTAVTTVAATDADLPAQTLTYSISGGADAAKFAINGSTGVLSFVAAPNYEAPTDAGGNNVYDVTVQVSDGTLTDTQAIAVTVTSVNDNNPIISSNGGGPAAAISIAENTTAVTTVTATDADLPAQTLTYSISGGADAAKFAINGSTGVLSFLAAPNYEAPADAGADNVYDVTVQVSDGVGGTDLQAIAVTVTDVNEAPVLSGTNNLTPINEDDGSNTGTLVSALIAGHVTDGDSGASAGIAVTAVVNTSGTWQYTTNGGTSWTAFGAPSDSAARLLAANANTRVRFVPNANWNGTVTGGLTFRAWDQTTGTAGNTANVTTNGGTTAFSATTASANLAVNPVNDAPVLSGTNNLTAINEDDGTNAGTLVSDLLAGKVSDIDAGAVSGIAVTAVVNTNGTWQYTTDGGGNWAAFGSPSANAARLLAADANTRVRFVPNANWNGTVTGGITFRAWDQTSGTAGGTANVTSNGGTTAFSAATASANLTVRVVNDAPSFTLLGDQTAAANSGLHTVAAFATDAPGGGSDEAAQTFTYHLSNDAAALFTAAPQIDSSGRLTYQLAAGVHGIATVTVSVQDSGGTANGGADTSAAQTFQIRVTGLAEAGGPYTIAEGAGLTLNAANSTQPLTGALSYAWDLNGDGTFGEATGVAPALTWNQLQALGINNHGSYPLAVRTSDGNGVVATDTATLTVTNTAPTLTVSGPATAAAGSPYVLTLGATDPGLLTVNQWTINWGDGAIDVVAGNPPSATHTYSLAGLTYNLTASARDADGTWQPSDLIVSGRTNNALDRYSGTTGAFLQQFGAGNQTATDDVVVGPDGLLYVVDKDTDRVLRYDAASGALIGTFVSAGSGGLSQANALAFGPDGNLYVAGTDTDEVLRYSGTTGAFLGEFVAAGSGGLNGPTGLLFHTDGKLYVSSFDGDSILRYDAWSGAFAGQFVTARSGTLDRPIGLTFGPDGNLYVASYGNDKVLEYDGATGFFLNAFVTSGSGGLNGPVGLRFGPDANLYVVDEGGDRVLRYEAATGTFRDAFVAAGSGGLDKPNALTFLPQQQVHVTGNVPPYVSPATFMLAENSANGTAVGTVSASDPNVGDVLSYAITAGNTSGAFAIDAATGQLTVANSAALDFETTPAFNLTVRSTDPGGLTGSATVTVNLTNVNEPPTLNPATFSLPENSFLGHVVGTVTASDPDVGDTPSFTILDGNASGAFFINSDTGEISVFNFFALNYESTPSFNLTVTATDDGGQQSTAAVIINLTNVNERPTVNSATFSLAENSANGTVVATVTASDPDAGDTHTFAITGGNTNGGFAIDASTGQMTVANSAALDFETTPTFSLTVQATDAGGLTDTETVTVALMNVNDHAPVARLDSYSVAEGLLLSVPGPGVLANDDDLDGDALTAQLVSGPSHAANFLLNPDGSFTYVHDGSETTGDSFTYEASDGNGRTATGTVNLTIAPQNDAPVISPPDGTLPYNENSGAKKIDAAASVADIDSADFDGGTLTVDFATGGTVNDRLAIRSGGQISVVGDGVFYSGTPIGTWTGGSDGFTPLVISLHANADPTATTALLQNITYENVSDDPAAASRTARLVLTDGDGGTSEPKTADINVSGINDAPVVGDQSFDVIENTLSGTNVGTIAFSDLDAGDSHAFTVLGGTGASAFSVNPTTGEITVADSSQLDYENTAGLTLLVQVTDDATLNGSDTATITILLHNQNEFHVGPVSDSDAAENQVSETAANGASVGITAWAADGDATDTVSYSLDDDADGRFQIDPDTGVITVQDHTLLDYETAPAHEVTVRATSSDGSSSTQTFTVGLTDDAAESSVGPVSDSDAAPNTVLETAANGTPVGITAWAADGDATDTVSYSLDDDAGGSFQIDPATGTITVRDSTLLDYETAAAHEVTVRATSSDGSSSTQTLTIGLTDDTAESSVGPVSDSDAAENQVSETVANGTPVGITAWAADGDATDTVSYSLDDDAGGRFQIDSATGTITVRDSTLLDYETAAAHEVTIRATSSDGSSSTQTFTVGLTDDAAESSVGPVSDSDAAENQVSETAANGTPVGITAWAADGDATDTVSYGLDDDAGGRFQIDPDTGVITVQDHTLLDYETAAAHEVTVRATSSDGSSSTQTLTIGLTDDAAESSVGPVSDSDAAENQVSETAADGTPVGITAWAADGDTTDTVSYSLEDDAGGRFQIDPATGAITVQDSTRLDYETATAHEVTVRATSSDGSISTRIFTVHVRDENDNPPVIVSNHLSVAEGETVVLGRVNLNSEDVDSHVDAGELTYTVRRVTGGDFELVTRPGVAVTSFTQTQVDLGQVAFVHDGGELAPTYEVTVSDGVFADGPQAANVAFANTNDVPQADHWSFELTALSLSADVRPAAADADGDPLTILLVAGPDHGTLRLAADGTFSYTPNDGFFGTDRFAFQASDGRSASNAATVSIAVIPGAVLPPPGADAGSSTSGEAPESQDSPEDSASESTTDTEPSEANLAAPEAAPHGSQRARASSATSDRKVELLADLDREAASRLLPIFVAPARAEAATSRVRVAASDRGTDAEAVRESRSAANQAVQESEAVFCVERSGRMWQELDEFHENLDSGLQFRNVAIGSVGTIVSGFTVGYVLWALRSGLLLTSLLASLPAWTMFDPLVIVTGNGTRDEDQEESLEQIVENQAALAATRPRQPETTESTR